jgi:hypothetical protein
MRIRFSMLCVTIALRRRRTCFAAMRRLRSDMSAARPSEAAITLPMLRMVPDVPMTRLKPARAI